MKGIMLKRKNLKITLSKFEVEHIVNEWYLNGMVDDILQNEDGRDLEEILDVDYSVKIKTIIK